MKKLYIIIILAVLSSCGNNSEEKYLAQIPPGLTPEIFAPSLISKTDLYEFGSVFSKDGNEFFYGVDIDRKSEIRYSKLENGSWSKSKTIISDEKFGFNDPFLSPNEDELYFISNRPLSDGGEGKDHDIWYSTRGKNEWSEPINAGSNINSSANEYYISFTSEKTMYFSSNISSDEDRRYDFDIYSSKTINGEFQPPIRLSDSVNSDGYEADVFVSPDESYLIFASTREVGLGEGDLYVSFKRDDDTWTRARNMGELINSSGHELCPFVSHDKKYFFYTSRKDIYWVDAKVIEKYR